ncbi:N-acetylmuramoyl-L-alanine amidase, partial [Mycobacterium tuberculosis]|nr:N-acetylmuramoyl-L-alanine amidase [Mycobacterium tuberculosis]
DIDLWHKERGFPVSSLGFYVGYHYVIEKSGNLLTARRESEIGAHTIGQNESSIGICLVGNFDVETPTQQQIATLGDML